MWFKQYNGGSPKRGLLFGLELEIEGSGIIEASSLVSTADWIVEGDSSLRNGLEFKSRTASSYEQTAGMIRQYGEFLNACKAKASPRTSVHIHMNTQDLNTEQMKSLVWLSVAMEPVILRFCSELRNHNGYCVPVYNSVNLVNFWRRFFQYLDGKLTKSQLTSMDRYKYAATGAFRLFDLGTIEYRMFPGCTDYTRLYWYIDILRSMYEIAISNPVEVLRDKKLSEGLLSIITSVIIEHRKNVTLIELEKLLERGIQMANDITREPLTREQLILKHRELFPSKFKPVTKSTLIDLYKSTNLQKDLSELDPDELSSLLIGRVSQVFSSLVALYPDEPASIAVFIRNLIDAGVAK